MDNVVVNYTLRLLIYSPSIDIIIAYGLGLDTRLFPCALRVAPEVVKLSCSIQYCSCERGKTQLFSFACSSRGYTAAVECALTLDCLVAVITLVYGRLTARRLPIAIFKFNVLRLL